MISTFFQWQPKKVPLVAIALLLCALYWLYLIIVAQPILVYDAVGYAQLGELIKKEGWFTYFHVLNREPLYPFLVSIAMNIASWTGIFWQDIQKSLQFTILLLTQLLMLPLLRKLKVSEGICAAVILYFGFSPAIVNSALSIYSEILTYPLTVGIILLTLKTWQGGEGGNKNTWVWACALGSIFVLLTFVKSIFECTFPFFLGALLFKTFCVLRNKENSRLSVWITAILVLVLTYYAAVVSYKYTNYCFNKNFTISAQSQFGPWNFYGNAVRRSQPLTRVEKMAALSAVPGEEFCERIYGSSTCYLWSLMKSDEIGRAQKNELISKGTRSVDKEAFRLSFRFIKTNPVQYSVLTFLEASKMIFWESTHIGFVAYPDWLSCIFDNIIFAYGITIIVGLMTLAGLIAACLFVMRNVKKMFTDHLPVDEAMIILFFSLLLIFPFCGAYAILFIIKRYLFPLVPLYLIFIAFLGQTCLDGKKQCRIK